jgi:PKD repeat protein
VNVPPTAAFTPTCTNMSCAFDASASTDPDGTIAGYSWDFGDGSAAGNGESPNHTYTTPGTYTVKLTVTDDSGASTTTSQNVNAALPPNQLPTATVTASCSLLVCAFDGTNSSDSDGTIAGYSWDFGNGDTSTAASPKYTYPTGGTYTITLTVTDNRGGTGTATKTVTVGANQAPTAAFTQSCTNLACSFDATTSADPDGSVASYAWSFGDGTTATGATPNHTFGALGQYPVQLTVTDNLGSTGTVTKKISVTALLASDAFGRTTTAGWGTADTGGAWSLSGAANTLFATGSGVGTMNLNAGGAAPLATLKNVSATNLVETVDVSADKAATNNGYYLLLKGRVVGTSNYTLKLRILPGGVVHLVMSKVVAGTETVFKEVNLPALTYNVGDTLRVQFAITGDGTTTTLTGSAWKVGTSAPNSPQVTQTDTDPTLQGAGAVALQGYLSGNVSNAPVNLSIDNFGVVASS